MKAVFKREFFSAFRRLYAYITVALTAIIAGIFFTVYNLNFAAENIVSVLSTMSLVTALIIPVVAVNSYPSRKREDTDVIYDMLPLSSKDVVLGKYFASLCVTMLPNAVLLIYPLIAGMYGTVDHLTSYSVLLGLVLFEAAWLAVCTFMAKMAKSRVRAYVWCYATVIVWYLLAIVNVLIPTTNLASLIAFIVTALAVGVMLFFALRKWVICVCVTVILDAVLVLAYILYPDSFSGAFEGFVDTLSIFEQFNLFIYGVFNLEGVVYFAVIALLFVFLTWRKYQQRYENTPSGRMNIKQATSAVLAVVMISASLAVTCAAAAVPNRFLAFDSTLAGKNSVSDEAKEFLSGIDKEVTLYLLEPTGIKDYELYLEKLTVSNPKLTLKRVYYANDPDFYADRDISTDSITANSLVVECGDKFEYISYLNMFFYSNKELGATQMTYSQYQYYYSMFKSSEQYADYLYSLVYNTTMYFNADTVICTYIEYVTADIIPTNYYLTGHGEKDINTVSNPYYGLGIIELDISTDGAPEDAASIFINMPEEDISNEEKDILIEYLSGGGQLTVVTNESNLDMPNLCAVLAAYGMSAEKGIVKEVQTATENDEERTETVTEFVPTVHTNNDILYYIEDTTDFAPTVKDANAITVDETAVEYLTKIPLLSSSDTSYIGDDPSNTESYTLACAVETPNGAKLVWFTGGEAFNVASTDSAMTVMYALSWVTLIYESDVGNIPAVVYSQPTAKISSGGAGLVAAIIIILPIAFGVMGGIVFYKRKKAK